MTFLLAALLAADAPDYERDVKPILSAHCAACHNADDANSGFRLDAYEHLVKPIDDEFAVHNGPSLIPGDAEASRIYRLMAGLDEPRMPPEGDAPPVAADALETVRRWIDAGAKGPDGGEPMTSKLVVPDLPAADSPRGVTAVAIVDGLVLTGGFGTVEARRDDIVVWRADGLSGKVNDLSISADGTVAVAGTGVAGLSGGAVGYDTQDGRELFRVRGHADAAYAVAVSADLVATASYDRTIILHDRATGQAVRTLTGHNGAVYDIALSPDGTLLASASGDETVKVWSVATGERLDTMSQPEGEVFAVAFSPNGDHIFAASADNRIRKWAVRSRTAPTINPLDIARFGHEGPVTALAVSETHVVTASADHTVKVWDAATLSLLKTWGPQPDDVTCVAIEGTGAVVARMDGSTDRYGLPPVTSSAGSRAESATPVFVTDREQTAYEEADAATLTAPASVQGAIASPGEVDEYTFEAKAGEQWVVEVLAARGSLGKEKTPLDSVVEVFDADGNRIPRVLLQAVRDSYFTFRGKNGSQSNDFRVFNWQEIELGELFYANGEVVRMWLYPDGPDSGFLVHPGQGMRTSLYDTTGVAHALGDPAYVVRPLPPGSDVAPNGLPVFPIYFRNDDESTGRHGRDSVLHFTPPADGLYTVHVTDARGYGGADYGYEFQVRPRRPSLSATLTGDFKADLVRGAAREWGVRITREDGFEGPVSVRVEGLPEGYAVPEEITVEAGQIETLFPLTVAENAAALSEDQRKAVKVIATADTEDGRHIEVPVGGVLPMKLSEAEPQVDVFVDAPLVDGVPTLDIRAGETASLKLRVDRREFKNRITFGKNDAGRNLPWAVFVDNIGLNGLMLTPAESERTFFITAAPVAAPQERWFHIRAELQGGLASNPVRVRVLPAGSGVAAK